MKKEKNRKHFTWKFGTLFRAKMGIAQNCMTIIVCEISTFKVVIFRMCKCSKLVIGLLVKC